MVLLFLTKSKYPDLSFYSLCSKITPCTLCKCCWSWLCLLAIKTCARLITNMYHHNEIRSYFTLEQVKFWFTKSHRNCDKLKKSHVSSSQSIWSVILEPNFILQPKKAFVNKNGFCQVSFSITKAIFFSKNKFDSKITDQMEWLLLTCDFLTLSQFADTPYFATIYSGNI